MVCGKVVEMAKLPATEWVTVRPRTAALDIHKTRAERRAGAKQK